MTRSASWWLVLSLLLWLSCRKPDPVAPIQPPTVSLIPSPTCDLPALPEPIEPQIVGLPTAETVMVSRSDMGAIVGYVTGLHDWIRAAAACLENHQSFYGEVNKFMGAR